MDFIKNNIALFVLVSLLLSICICFRYVYYMSLITTPGAFNDPPLEFLYVIPVIFVGFCLFFFNLKNKRILLLAILLIVYPIMQMRYACFPPAKLTLRSTPLKIDYYLITIKSNQLRFELFKTNKYIPKNLNVIYGLDKELNKTNTMDDWLNFYNISLHVLSNEQKKLPYRIIHFMGYYKTLEFASVNSQTADWIVLLEDDAMFLSWYEEYEQHVFQRYNNYDVISLDSKSIAKQAVRIFANAGIVGVAFNKRSLAHILKIFSLESPEMQVYLNRGLTDPYKLAVDSPLHNFCEGTLFYWVRHLNCIHAPMISERFSLTSTALYV